ncbi:helix-turn-helix domain-containing protein [Faecalimonas sp.]
MSNDNEQNKKIGLRIRTARKEKGLNQTQLANMLGKSLRTIQKYESGEIEISIATINDIAKYLECQSSYLIGYDMDKKPLSQLSDIINFIFQLDKIQDLGFNIDVKRPPSYDGWSCSLTFDGKDFSSELNQDLCLFLEEFKTMKERFANYQLDLKEFEKWQDKTLAYYANTTLKEKEYENISTEERIRRFNKLMNERYGMKES